MQKKRASLTNLLPGARLEPHVLVSGSGVSLRRIREHSNKFFIFPLPNNLLVCIEGWRIVRYRTNWIHRGRVRVPVSGWNPITYYNGYGICEKSPIIPPF